MRTNPNQYEINREGRDNTTWSSTPASDRMRNHANDLAATDNIYEEDCDCCKETLTTEDREKRIEELDELIHDKIGDGKYDEDGNLIDKDEYTLTDEEKEKVKVADTAPLDPAADRVTDPINVNSSEIVSEPVAISDPLAGKETTTEDGTIPVNDIDDTLMDRLNDVDCGCGAADTTAGSETGEIIDPGYPEDVMTTTTRNSALIDDGENLWIVESVETTVDDTDDSDISAVKEDEPSQDNISQKKDPGAPRRCGE